MIGGHPKIAIRLSNWLGDLVMSLPAVETIRRTFPEAEIVAIARPHLDDLVRHPKGLIDRVIHFRDRDPGFGMRAFFSFCRQLRLEGFDRSFVLTRHPKGALMMWLAGVPNRVGFSVLRRMLRFSRKGGRRTGKKHRGHDSERYLTLLRDNGFGSPNLPVVPRLEPDPDAQTRVVKDLLEGNPQPYLVLHAGAAYGTAKRWLPERFAQLGRRFQDRFGGAVILLGVASEADVNASIAQHMERFNVINLCDRTSLAQTLAIVSQARVFVSNDSGLMHVAAAFSRPQVAIFGPTDVSATFPYNANSVLIWKDVFCRPCFKRHCPIDHRCMTRIQTDDVWQAVKRLMRDGC